jgi:hypothetical protein
MTDFKLPETRYTFSGDVSIAYQVMGDGSVDIIVVPGLFSHVEFLQEMSGYTAFPAPIAELRPCSNLRQKRSGSIGQNFRALPHWNSAWTTCVQSWTRSARGAPSCLGSRKAVQ